MRGCHFAFNIELRGVGCPCKPDVFAATFEPAHPQGAPACPSPDDRARAGAILDAWSEQCRSTANPNLLDLIATALAAARQEGATAAFGLEKAARLWFASLADDGWDERTIRQDLRPGIADLYDAVQALPPVPLINDRAV